MKKAAAICLAFASACVSLDEFNATEQHSTVAAPTSVVAAAVSDSRIQITWDAVSGAFKYYVYRAVGAGPFEYVDTALAPTTTSLSISLAAATEYRFQVVTEMDDGTPSDVSETAIATTFSSGLNNVPTPTNVAAAPVSESRIQITWDPIPHALKYYVYRAEGAAPLTYVGTELAPSTTSLSIDLAPNTQYSFAVGTSMDDGSESSSYSAPVTATTYAPGLNNVPTPANVSAAAVSDSRIQITWDPIPHAFKYYVYRAEGAGPLTYVGTELAPSTTSLSVNLTPSTQYSFAIGTAMDDGAESSSYSTPVTATTYASGLNNVPTPANVAASPVSDSRIQLSWDPVPHAFKYYIYRAEGAGPLVYIDTTLAPSTTSLSINLTASTQYSFAVGTAMDDGSESSSYSTPITATTYASGLNNVPTPTNVAASPVSDSRIQISWDPVPHAFKYYIYRAEGAGPLVYVDTALAPSTTSLSINLAANTQYSFAVGTAMDDGSESSGYSTPVTASTYSSGQNNVATPSGVTATAISSTQIDVSWTAVSGAAKYYVYRAEGAGPMEFVDSVISPAVTFSSTNLAPATTYSFAVATAMADGSESVGASNPVSASTSAAPVPTNVVASATSSSTISVSWDAVPSAFKYYVFRATGSGAMQLVDVAVGSTAHTSEDLASETEYHYEIVAVLTDGTETAASARGSATTF